MQITQIHRNFIFMNKIDLWRLCDPITLPEASLLILGIDPEDQESHPENLANPPSGYKAISTALKNAIESERLEAKIYYRQDDPNEPRYISWHSTKIAVYDLKQWLEGKGFTNNFFFHEKSILQNYLDPNHECYAPKLSAAVNAWIEVTTSSESLNGKTPKQALDKWLRLNANNYGLTKDTGRPNESAIEEISKIANWKLEGGVAKTNTRVQSKPTKGSNKPTPDIPF
jgi:hypothetical protein